MRPTFLATHSPPCLPVISPHALLIVWCRTCIVLKAHVYACFFNSPPSALLLVSTLKGKYHSEHPSLRHILYSRCLKWHSYPYFVPFFFFGRAWCASTDIPVTKSYYPPFFTPRGYLLLLFSRFENSFFSCVRALSVLFHLLVSCALFFWYTTFGSLPLRPVSWLTYFRLCRPAFPYTAVRRLFFTVTVFYPHPHSIAVSRPCISHCHLCPFSTTPVSTLFRRQIPRLSLHPTAFFPGCLRLPYFPASLAVLLFVFPMKILLPLHFLHFHPVLGTFFSACCLPFSFCFLARSAIGWPMLSLPLPALCAFSPVRTSTYAPRARGLPSPAPQIPLLHQD